MPRRGSTAIVAKRVDERPIDTGEIRALAESAGYEIADVVTQVRAPDPDTEFGEGVVEDLADRVDEHDADVVIVDDDLEPNRAFRLRDRIDCEVIDRKRLVIDVFAERAGTRQSQLEVRLAELRYELPLAEERVARGEASGRMGFKSRGEPPAERVRANYRRQIQEVESQLAEMDDTVVERREDRHEEGFDLVALAGYTNAGKSTLLRRLADDLSVDENEGKHADLDPTAESQDRLFTTLDTTTRRATIEGRRLLLTDTVGFLSGLPHWFVESFESTLSAAYEADAVCLVVDASDDSGDVRRKTETSASVLADHREGGVRPVLNKVDLADDVAEKRDIVADVTGADPVTVSALDGTGLDALASRLDDVLPDREEATVRIPASNEGMSLVSWIHDHAEVRETAYRDGEVTVSLRSRPEVVDRATGRARSL